MEWGSLFFSEPRLSSWKRHWRPTANEGSNQLGRRACRALVGPHGPTWAQMPSKVTQAHSQYMSISNPQHLPLNYLDIYLPPKSQGSHSLLSASLRFCDCWQANCPMLVLQHKDKLHQQEHLTWHNGARTAKCMLFRESNRAMEHNKYIYIVLYITISWMGKSSIIYSMGLSMGKSAIGNSTTEKQWGFSVARFGEISNG